MKLNFDELDNMQFCESVKLLPEYNFQVVQELVHRLETAENEIMAAQCAKDEYEWSVNTNWALSNK